MCIGVLFGAWSDRDTLIRLAVHGPQRASGIKLSSGLRASGIVADYVHQNARYLALDTRHPLFDGIRNVLFEVAREPLILPRGPAARSNDGHNIDGYRPTGHINRWSFRLLLEIVRCSGEVEIAYLKMRLSGVRTQAFKAALQELEATGVARHSGSCVFLSPDIPAAYIGLVIGLGEILAKRDPRLMVDAPSLPPAPRAFRSASDGAPKLFGSDLRLRTLMAVAKYGPLTLKDLSDCLDRKICNESADAAPFGRGGIVHEFDSAEGPAVELHPRHPLRIQLRALLLALEKRYPVPWFYKLQPPSAMPPAKWNGDRYSTFGSDIVTTILFSIGVLGWTFEALCVRLCSGHDRVVVKNVAAALT